MLQSLVATSGAYALGVKADDTNAPLKNSGNPASPAWPYTTLDQDLVADTAYHFHDQKGSCMYAVFSSVIKQLAEKQGEPFRSFPCDMMIYGEGGVSGWGTICGALNGGAAAISLLVPKEADRRALIDELFLWYQNTNLPSYKPAKPFFAAELPAVKPGSILCHPSVSAWIKQAKVGFYSKERKERCTRLSADTAHKTVELLNRFCAGTFSKEFKLDQKTTDCMSCHGKGGAQADVMIKTCTGCHFPAKNQHP